MSRDGVHRTTATRTTRPFEQTEAKYPIAVRALSRCCQDSGGAGRHRGGLGIEQRGAGALADLTSTRRSSACTARRGASTAGAKATGNQVALRLDGKWKTDLPNAKVLIAQLEAGRCLPSALGRRRRLRRPARARRPSACRRCAAGLCFGRGGREGLWRGPRSHDVYRRSSCNRSLARRARRERVGDTRAG